MPAGSRAPRILVVGVGNDLRGDDAAGRIAVRELRGLLGASAAVDILEHSGDGPSLIEAWAGRRWVLLVDAVHSDEPPGTVVHADVTVRPLDCRPEPGSTHAFGAAGAIELARCLGRLPERIEVYGISGSLWTIGAGPRREVVAAARRVAREIVDRTNRRPEDASPAPSGAITTPGALGPRAAGRCTDCARFGERCRRRRADTVHPW
jgi:hydrogenase maturation protease